MSKHSFDDMNGEYTAEEIFTSEFGKKLKAKVSQVHQVLSQLAREMYKIDDMVNTLESCRYYTELVDI